MNSDRIKNIRIGLDLIVVLYTLIFLVIIIIIISLGPNPPINEMLYLIFFIIILMIFMALVRDTTLYGMWEDIIEAIEECKNNKPKNE
jgi:c-di-AMP phosphodiesterase-like protein